MKNQQNDKIELLEHIPLFKGLSYEQMLAIANVAFFKTYNEDDIIIAENVPSRFLYIICSGQVKILKSSKSGKIKILGFLTAGDFFGEISLLTDYNPSATVQCKVKTKLLILGREDFLNLIRGNFEITQRILAETSRRLYHADIDIVDLSFESILHRFISTILLLAKKTPEIESNQKIIDIPLTHKEMGEIIGTRRELITKILSKLKKDKYIEISRDRRIKIIDVKGIKRLMR